jgi:hypothetical protein
MTALAYINNAYKLLKNNYNGIEESLEFAFPNLCEENCCSEGDISESNNCNLSINTNVCDLKINLI